MSDPVHSPRLWLKSLGLRLGSKLSVQRPGDWTEEPRVALGQVLVCTACSKVVGVYTNLSLEMNFLDVQAGVVEERRFKFMEGAFVCGADGCDRSPGYQNPIACSDECESRLLFDPRFEECEPSADYKRFSAGLESA